MSLEADIHAALGTSTTETVTKRLANPRGELPPEVRQLLRERRGAKRRAIRTRLPQDKRAANQLNKRVKAALAERAQERWRLHLDSLDPRDNSLWKTKKAIGNTRRAMPPIHGENGVVCRKLEKAEAMVDSLELQCRENYLPNEDEEHTGQVERRIRRLGREPEQDILRHATPKEIKEILRKLIPRKAEGYDRIGNRILKKLPHRGVMALTNIADAVLRLRHFPNRWKKADVIMIPKPGKDHKFPAKLPTHQPTSGDEQSSGENNPGEDDGVHGRARDHSRRTVRL